MSKDTAYAVSFFDNIDKIAHYSLMLALILALIFILFLIVNLYIVYGLQLYLRLDLNNLSICVKVFAAQKIQVFCFKAFVCDGEFYCQINKNEIKKLTLKKENEDGGREAEYSVDWLRRVNYLLTAVPDLNIKKLHVYYDVAFDDPMSSALFDGAVKTGVSTVLAVSNKIKVKDFKLKNEAYDGNFKGAEVYCQLGFAIFPLLTYLIKAKLSKRKFAVKA